jgi:hypothetical protein
MLDTQSKPEFLNLQFHLGQLFHSLMPSLPTKVDPLSEPATSMGHLDLNTESNGERMATTGTQDRSSTNNLKFLKRFKNMFPSSTSTGELSHKEFGKSNARNKKSASIKQPLLQASATRGESSIATKPIRPSHDATPEINKNKNTSYKLPRLRTARRVLKKKSDRLLSYVIGRKPNAKSTESTSLLEPLLGADATLGAHSVATEPASPSHIVLTEASPKSLISAPASEEIRQESEGISSKAYSDAMRIVKKHMISKDKETWNALQEALIRFQDQKHVAETDAKFLLGFLKTLYLLGEWIHEYQLMPSKFIEEVEIFQPKTLLKMVEYYIDLMFSKWHETFFDIPGSLTPQLEYLTTGRAVKHFNRSIKGKFYISILNP